jgi:mannose-6-phosphate isomerase-like protein (cupin superfamily)
VKRKLPRVGLLVFTTALVTTPTMMEGKFVVSGKNFKFNKTYSQGKEFSTGFIRLPPGAEKPNKNTKESSMIFVVLKGVVDVYIHRSEFKASPSTEFCVPSGMFEMLTLGNQYRLCNTGDEEAELHFTQVLTVRKDNE